jgi:chemotaxis protein methyltransferase CheR
MEISDGEFIEISEFLNTRLGIYLKDDKRALVANRLERLVLQKGLSSFSEFLSHLKNDISGRELSEVIDRITTGHTFFFRESDHFDFLSGTVLPEITAAMKKRNSNDLRIWCAGCSSGEEPYSIVIRMMETFGTSYQDWDAGVLATDISKHALEWAASGVYPADRLSTVPEIIKQRYFRELGDGQWQASERIKNEITFRRFNLINPLFPFKKSFQIIFCRNVMIYFNLKTREELLRKFFRVMEPGGYLFLGHSEGLLGHNLPFRYVRPGVFRKG